MLDIIFISYDEINAEKNFRNLKSRFPHAKRVHGVKGIANAHIAAAKKANTTFFYVVDADAEILETFKFDYKPSEFESQYVHIWHAFNPAIGMDYGYGGVKLFSRKFFSNVKTQLDFSTTLTKDIKVINEIACITKFNSDPIRSFRGAFRETAKLYVQSNKENIPDIERKQARERLSAWIDPLDNCDFRQFVVAGSHAGIKAAKSISAETDLLFINNHDLMIETLLKIYPEIDFNTNPNPSESHPMKREFFFTTRIASALYDDYVLEKMPITELRDAISDGQILSKNWLIEELSTLINDNKIQASKESPLRIAILGGWIGTLALMINVWELPVKITSVDLDDRASKIAEKLNYDFDFSAVTMDMYDVNYSEYDVIINTSSEHIPNPSKWREKIPAGKILIVQNNDYVDGAGHVSTVKNSAALSRILKLNSVLYEGTRSFPQYNRFMIIGKT